MKFKTFSLISILSIVNSIYSLEIKSTESVPSSNNINNDYCRTLGYKDCSPDISEAFVDRKEGCIYGVENNDWCIIGAIDSESTLITEDSDNSSVPENRCSKHNLELCLSDTEVIFTDYIGCQYGIENGQWCYISIGNTKALEKNPLNYIKETNKENEVKSKKLDKINNGSDTGLKMANSVEILKNNVSNPVKTTTSTASSIPELSTSIGENCTKPGHNFCANGAKIEYTDDVGCQYGVEEGKWCYVSIGSNSENKENTNNVLTNLSVSSDSTLGSKCTKPGHEYCAIGEKVVYTDDVGCQYGVENGKWCYVSINESNESDKLVTKTLTVSTTVTTTVTSVPTESPSTSFGENCTKPGHNFCTDGAKIVYTDDVGCQYGVEEGKWCYVSTGNDNIGDSEIDIGQINETGNGNFIENSNIIDIFDNSKISTKNIDPITDTTTTTTSPAALSINATPSTCEQITVTVTNNEEVTITTTVNATPSACEPMTVTVTDNERITITSTINQPVTVTMTEKERITVTQKEMATVTERTTFTERQMTTITERTTFTQKEFITVTINSQYTPITQFQGNPQGNPQGNLHGNPQGNPQGNLHGNPQGNPQGNPHGNPHGNPQSNPQFPSNTQNNNVVENNNCGDKWAQCGGIGFNGSLCCKNGLNCQEINQYLSQCL